MMSQEVFDGLTHQPQVYKIVLDNVQKTQDRIQKRKLKKEWEDNFKVGDVLKKNSSRKGGKKGEQQKTVANIDQITAHSQRGEDSS